MLALAVRMGWRRSGSTAQTCDKSLRLYSLWINHLAWYYWPGPGQVIGRDAGVSYRAGVHAVFPRRDVASAVGYVDMWFCGDGSPGLPDRRIRCRLPSRRGRSCATRCCCRRTGYPPCKWREVRRIGDVPDFHFRVPAGAQCLHRILFRERRDQVDSHAGDYRASAICPPCARPWQARQRFRARCADFALDIAAGQCGHGQGLDNSHSSC